MRVVMFAAALVLGIAGRVAAQDAAMGSKAGTIPTTAPFAPISVEELPVTIAPDSKTIPDPANGVTNTRNNWLPEFTTTEEMAQLSMTQLISNEFNFKLFAEVRKNNSDKNVFISPQSVAFALAMLYNGASGATQQAIAEALELNLLKLDNKSRLSLQQINSLNAALIRLLENPDPSPEVRLSIANSLWAKKDADLNAEFIQKSQEFYKAKVTNLDFADKNASSIINDWLNESKHGKKWANQTRRAKIRNIIFEKIDPDQVLFLVNATFFKGRWMSKFDKNQTAYYPFYLSSTEQKRHPMMSQTSTYQYYENDQFQAVSLPYGKNGTVSFYAFLPKPSSSLETFYQNLNAENWKRWMSQLERRELFIRLPLFTAEVEVEYASLNQALTDLGMGEAFAKKADFSGIGKNLFLSEVKHTTFIKVNEEGTGGAADFPSPVVAATSTKQPTEPLFRMIVDRPFFFVIRENQTGAILFMGSILEPEFPIGAAAQH